MQIHASTCLYALRTKLLYSITFSGDLHLQAAKYPAQVVGGVQTDSREQPGQFLDGGRLREVEDDEGRASPGAAARNIGRRKIGRTGRRTGERTGSVRGGIRQVHHQLHARYEHGKVLNGWFRVDAQNASLPQLRGVGLPAFLRSDQQSRAAAQSAQAGLGYRHNLRHVLLCIGHSGSHSWAALSRRSYTLLLRKPTLY